MNTTELIEKNLLDEMTFTSDQEKQEFAVQISDTLMERVMKRVVVLLNETQTTELESELEKTQGDMEAIIVKMTQFIPNFPEIMGDEMMGLKEELAMLLEASK